MKVAMVAIWACSAIFKQDLLHQLFIHQTCVWAFDDIRTTYSVLETDISQQ